MPFKSEKQRRYMHMAHPDIADRWEHEGRSGKKRKGGRKKSSRKKKGRRSRR